MTASKNLLQARLLLRKAESCLNAAWDTEYSRSDNSSLELLEKILDAWMKILPSKAAVRDALKQCATDYPASSVAPEEILDLLDVPFHDDPSDELAG